MTRSFRTTPLAIVLFAAAAGDASAQRSRGTMGVPRVVTTPPPAPPVRSTPRGRTAGPRGPSVRMPRAGDLPRIVTETPRRSSSGFGRSYGTASTYNNGPRGDHRSRYWRPPYTRWGVGSGCGYGCFRIGTGIRTSRFLGSFVVGYPFAVPIMVPYFYNETYLSYGQPVVENYAPAPQPASNASKLIVVGGGTAGGGDALTVETVGDSVRLSWIGAGRPASEVTLFVSDSARKQLATRSASPASPTATFEVVTLSAPVAFAGVTVTFSDGVTSTTVVPYRASMVERRQR